MDVLLRAGALLGYMCEWLHRAMPVQSGDYVVRETMKAARYVSLINFPGPDGTTSLLDVLADNRARLKAAAGY